MNRKEQLGSSTYKSLIIASLGFWATSGFKLPEFKNFDEKGKLISSSNQLMAIIINKMNKKRRDRKLSLYWTLFSD